jgi:hypothetical protein
VSLVFDVDVIEGAADGFESSVDTLETEALKQGVRGGQGFDPFDNVLDEIRAGRQCI